MLATTNIRRKHRLLAYALEHDIEVPAGFDPAAPRFGGAARRLLGLVQRDLKLKVTGRWSLSLSRRLPLTLRVVKHDWRFRYALSRRIGNPPGIIWHHAAAKILSPEQVQSIDLANGWSGFGYHRYVRKNGTIHAGRPLWAIGAHARGYNHWLGICAEGNYETEKTMPVRQLVALKYLHAIFHHDFPRLVDRRHKDVNATACPGKHYPFGEVTK